MVWEIIEPESAEELCSVLMRFSDDSRYAARGQGRLWEQLTTSLDRILLRSPQMSEAECAAYEHESIRVFHAQAPTYLDKAEQVHLNFQLGTVLLMQHFGAPTRLLDWTRSPWVATYFCVLSNTDEPGEIWIFDFDTLANEIYGRLFGGVSNRIVNASIGEVWQQGRFSPTPPSWLATFVPSNMNPRMMAQQAVFTLAGLRQNHESLIDQYLADRPGAKSRIVVSPAVKQAMRGRLVRMNVTASALFPGVDGLGRFIAQLIETAVPRA